MAHKGIPYTWHLSKKRTVKDLYKKEHSEGGWIHIRIPLRITKHVMDTSISWDYISLAERFFEVALHEFHHVREYQEGGHSWSTDGRPSRRPTWKHRPEERRAIKATKAALFNIRTEPVRFVKTEALIIALAEEIERFKNTKPERRRR